MIYLGADHRGYKLKQELYAYLKMRGFMVEDLGTRSEQPVDYPRIAEKVARKVVEDPNNRGILLCGSGAGVCIVANKIPGILGAAAWDLTQIKAIRSDDNINLLCLASDYLSSDQARELTQVFLDTSFSGAPRHNRRLKEIREIERKK